MIKQIAFSISLLGLGFGPLLAQTDNTITLSGAVQQLNYDPEGATNGLVIAPNSLVQVPPDWMMRMGGALRPGEQVRVTGYVIATGPGPRIVQPVSMSISGRTLTMTQPAQPAPYTGSGAIRQLNYGPGGEVNGFVLQNGIYARTPPFGAADISVLRPGANLAVSGFAHTTPFGMTVLDVQSITANGQTIAMNAAPGPGPGPRPRGPRGPGRVAPAAGVGAPPPPPPPPDAPPPPPR